MFKVYLNFMRWYEGEFVGSMDNEQYVIVNLPYVPRVGEFLGVMTDEEEPWLLEDLTKDEQFPTIPSNFLDGGMIRCTIDQVHFWNYSDHNCGRALGDGDFGLEVNGDMLILDIVPEQKKSDKYYEDKYGYLRNEE